mmetsp:Transcript_17312/g.30811  ORF Transcript_17312/g.30811 Transcript_17312/m.30811 type:complete len:127 (+) Transcript_17312:79-459(+)
MWCNGAEACCADKGDPNSEVIVPSESVLGRKVTGQSLEFVFTTDEGAEKVITFTNKPIGVFFAKKRPIVVSDVNPGSLADKLGVKAGWEIQSIGGASLEQCESHKDAIAVIMKQLETLSEVPDANI